MSAAAAGVAVWLAAFGGASGITGLPDRVQFSQSPPWVTIASPHQDVADSAVLTVGELPPGWVVLADDDDDFEPDRELSDYCQALEETASNEGVDALAISETMGGPQDQRLVTDAAVFSSTEDAQRSVDNFREFFSRCGPDYIAQLEEGVRRGAAKDGIIPSQLQIQTTMSDLGVQGLGESGWAFRISGTVAGPSPTLEFAVDLITFRIGRMGGGVIYTQIGGVRPEEQQAIAQLAAAKLQSANASLVDA